MGLRDIDPVSLSVGVMAGSVFGLLLFGDHILSAILFGVGMLGFIISVKMGEEK